MKILSTGASGMVGQGVLRECLAADDVTGIVSLVRAPTSARSAKLVERAAADFSDLGALEADIHGIDACFYCAGASAFRMAEAAYAHVTYELTLSVARALVRLNPDLVFVYVSGAGADSSERGRTMWARVKGRTENALLTLACRAYMFRPGFIRPGDGIVSKTALYRTLYRMMTPLMPLLERAMPRLVTTTRQVGRAMRAVARNGAPKRILETPDINAL